MLRWVFNPFCPFYVLWGTAPGNLAAKILSSVIGPPTFRVWTVHFGPDPVKNWLKTSKVNKSPAADSTCKIGRIFQIISSQLSLKCYQLECQQFKRRQYIWLIDKFGDRRGVTNFINKWTFVTKFFSQWNVVTNFHFVTNTTVTIYINTTPSATTRLPISTRFRILRAWTFIWDQWTGIISTDTATKWTTTEKSKNWSLRDASDDSKIDKVAKSKFKV